MNTLSKQFPEWVKNHRVRSNGTPWVNFCGAFVNSFVAGTLGWKKAPVVYGPTVDNVRSHTDGVLRLDKGNAPAGAFHWWVGHVGIDLDGDGVSVAMASSHVTSMYGSQGIGIMSVDGYSQKSGRQYLGWSANYGGGIIDGIEKIYDEIIVGSQVKIIDPVQFNGKSLDSWVTQTVFTVSEIKGKRVVLSRANAVIAAVNIDNVRLS